MLSIVQLDVLVGLDAVKVGLPDAVQESRERVRSAVRKCHLDFAIPFA